LTDTTVALYNRNNRESRMNQYTGIYRRCELWFIRRELEQFGLQPLEGKIIMFLQDNQCTQEDIGAHFDLDKGRIARNLSELEEKGLVRRLINEKNKRQKFVSLTVRGNQVLEEIHRISGRWDEICFAGFTEEERGQQQDYLRRIAENAIEYKHRVGECTYGK
jgi:DNA-binding MarR family transcriptional regulator